MGFPQGGGQRQDAMHRSYRAAASRSAPAPLSIPVMSVVPCAGRGRGTAAPHQPPSPSQSRQQCRCRAQAGDGGQWFLFPPGTLTPASWWAVSTTPAFCGKTAPLYLWTSWFAGKVPSTSRCGNSRSAAPVCSVALHYNPGKSGSGFLPPPRCWWTGLDLGRDGVSHCLIFRGEKPIF